MSKAKIKKLTLGFFIALLLVTFFSRSIHNLTLTKVRVDYVKAGKLFIETVFEYNLKSNTVVLEYADKTAQIKNIFYQNGDKVYQGDVIYILDESNFVNELKNLEFQLISLTTDYEYEKQYYDNILNNSSNEYKSILWKAETEYTTSKLLAKTGNVSTSILNNAELDYLIATDRYNRLIHEQKMKMRNIQYEINVIQVSIEKCKKTIESCTIISRENGVLTDMTLKEGMYTNINSLLFAVISNSNGFNIEYELSERVGKYLKTGDLVTVKSMVSNETGQFAISNIVFANTTYKITIPVKHEAFNLNDRVSISIKKLVSVYPTLMPLEAVHSDVSGDFVYVLLLKEGPLGKEYYAEKRVVTVGAKNLRYAGLNETFTDDTQVILRSSNALLGDLIEVNLDE